MIYIDSIALYSPSMPDWAFAREVLLGNRNPLSEGELDEPRYQPELLPRNERRRATTSTRLAFRLAESIKKELEVDLSETASVFASSGGDYEVIDAICRSLLTEEKQVSPTHFHNSVHNAPAGYWGIASGSHASSTSVSAFDDTFAMGLFEAGTQVVTNAMQTLFVAYDIAVPVPLLAKRSIDSPFGIAMLLAPQKSRRTIATMSLEFTTTPSTDHGQPSGNPIARGLPLLRQIAIGQTGVVSLPVENSTLKVSIET